MYRDLYFHLFNAITDALAAMEASNYGQAAKLLKRAQQDVEERYMDGDAEPSQNQENRTPPQE